MSETIKELENKIAKIKKKELEYSWEKYLKQTHNYLKSIIGKPIVTKSNSYSMLMFKPIAVEEQYYADQIGSNGQWHPKRWLELTTAGYISIYNNEISHKDLTFKFIKLRRIDKVQNVNISSIKFNSGTLSKSAYKEHEFAYKFGYAEYENSGNPSFKRALSNWSLFNYFISDEAYNAAMDIYTKTAQLNIDYFEKYTDSFNNLKKIYEHPKFPK